MMAYGKDMPETPHGPRILHKARREPRSFNTSDSIDDRKQIKPTTLLRFSSYDPFYFSVIRGIQERMEFLNDMECLGMEKKYRPIIQQEVAHKLRLIEAVDKQRSKEIRKDIRKLEKPLPKPLPLGQLDEN